MHKTGKHVLNYADGNEQMLKVVTTVSNVVFDGFMANELDVFDIPALLRHLAKDIEEETEEYSKNLSSA